MAEHVQWGSIASSGGNGEKGEYLKLKSGGTYKIRPIFYPVKFYKYFHKNNGKLTTAICAKPNSCEVKDRHPELSSPSLRFAAYVIDRADGKVKILEAPQTVFRPIGGSFEATGKEPGSSKDGSDFQIKVTGTGLNTKYEVAYAGASPLTVEEKASVKEALDGDTKKLQKLYKVDTASEIEEKLFGDGKKDNSSAPASAPSVDAVDSGFGESSETPAVDDGDWENDF